jgi:hypothetical protein
MKTGPILEEVMGHVEMLSMISSPDEFRGLVAVVTVFLLCVVIVSVFSFVSIAVWSDARRKEREAYYRAETMRRIGEAQGDGGKYLLEMMREEERIRVERERHADFKKLQGMKVGGVVNIGVGAALMIFLYFLASGDTDSGRFSYLVGLIPGFIGIALLASGIMIAPPRSRE